MGESVRTNIILESMTVTGQGDTEHSLLCPPSTMGMRANGEEDGRGRISRGVGREVDKVKGRGYEGTKKGV